MKNVGTRELKTERLLLRKIRLEDAEPLRKSGSLAGSPDEVAKNVEQRIADYVSPYCFHWVIDLDGKPIGRVQAWEIDLNNDFCQLGYDIATEYRGRGFMTETLKTVLNYLLAVAEFNRVYCSVRVSNVSSNKVCEKAGMTHDGRLRKHFRCGDGFEDVNVWSVIRDDLR